MPLSHELITIQVRGKLQKILFQKMVLAPSSRELGLSLRETYPHMLTLAFGLLLFIFYHINCAFKNMIYCVY